MISVKTVRDLAEAPYDGDINKYREWHDLMRDHLLGSNQGYGRILHELSQRKVPLTMALFHA